jgi:hypothetical protein
MSDLSDFIDDAILNWLSQKPMSRKELQQYHTLIQLTSAQASNDYFAQGR